MGAKNTVMTTNKNVSIALAMLILKETKKYFKHNTATKNDKICISAIGAFIGGTKNEQDLRSIIHNINWCAGVESIKRIIGRGF